MTNNSNMEAALKEHMLDCMIMAALGGHDLGEWKQADIKERGFQAYCRQCGQSIYASHTVYYSLLDDTCSKANK